MKIIYHKLVQFVCLAVLTIALFGCSSFTQQKVTRENCSTSRLLLKALTQTRLTKAMLPNGDICPTGAV